MFDIGFWELALVGVVALIVVGPERLPGLARTVGLWLGRARRFVSSVKADVERETRQEELQKILNKQNEFRGAFDIVEETRDTLKETGESARETVRSVQRGEGEAKPDGTKPDGAKPGEAPAEAEHERKP